MELKKFAIIVEELNKITERLENLETNVKIVTSSANTQYKEHQELKTEFKKLCDIVGEMQEPEEVIVYDTERLN